MSRLGKLPVSIPDGVQASVANGIVSIQGPQGKLEHTLGKEVAVKLEDGNLIIDRLSDGNEARANHGTTRAILDNMVHGVKDGWKKSLELHGVGYNAKLSGQTLTLNVGLSHSVVIDVPQEVKVKVSKTEIDLESCDKQLLGNVAASIKRSRPPEPYLGKGIRLKGEQIRRKAGKTGK